MKAKIILINWCLSLFGLCVDTDNNPLWIVFIAVAWFVLSTLLLKYADKKGWLKNIYKQIKMDKL